MQSLLTPHRGFGRSALFLLSCTALALPTHAQGAAGADQGAGARLARRIPEQQSFLFEYVKEHPVPGTTVDEQFRWMEGAARAWTESFRRSCEPADADSRMGAFSPYLWSWTPMVVAQGAPDRELSNRTQVEHVWPALLADLETVVEEREAGAPHLLKTPDVVNGRAHAELLVEVDRSLLERFQAAIERLPPVISKWQAQAAGKPLPRHLRAAVGRFDVFSALIDVELGLRDGRLEIAQAQLAALAAPGALPSGFTAFVPRLARAYADAGRHGAALAVLDLGLLATTEGSWPAAELEPLYASCGGHSGPKRFELAVARRAAPLVLSSLRFDPSSLVDVESGEALDLAALEGKPLVLDFMQRYCIPCMEAVPKLQQFHEEHPEAVLLAIVVDTPENREAAVGVVRERGGRYALFHDTANQAEKLGVYGYPSYFVVSPDGFVMQQFGMSGGSAGSFDDVTATLEAGRQKRAALGR